MDQKVLPNISHMIPLEGQVTTYSESVDIKLKKSSCRVDSEYELEKYNTLERSIINFMV